MEQRRHALEDRLDTGDIKMKFGQRDDLLLVTRHSGPVREPGEESFSFFPHCLSAGNPCPVSSYEADKAETEIDRKNEVLPFLTDAIHEECLNIRFHSGKRRIPGAEFLPMF